MSSLPEPVAGPPEAASQGSLIGDELVPRPAQGRVYEMRRRVRLGDSTAGGRLRLDACARYLQDIANDDSRDAGSPNPTAWVARRTMISIEHFPSYLDMVSLSTWCSGLGPRWAERRYEVTGEGSEGAGRIDAATLWVHVDMATMKPIPVPTGFAEQFGAAAGGRTIKARLHLPSRPPADATGLRVRPWPLRVADFDILGHVNNAVYWAIVEEEIAAQRHRERATGAPMSVTLEHHDGIDRDDVVEVVVCDREVGFDLWVSTTSGKVAAAVRAG